MKLYSLALPLFLFLAATNNTGCDDTTAKQEMKQNEDNQLRLSKAVPAPNLQTSLERHNLVRRLERINRDEMIGYIYLIDYGRVMAYYTVRGKVSSLNSYLTAMERIEVRGANALVLEAPDLDGSYGKNVEGIFFFTTEGAYVEWRGAYLWSDQPLKLNTPVEMIQIIPTKEKK